MNDLTSELAVQSALRASGDDADRRNDVSVVDSHAADAMDNLVIY